MFILKSTNGKIKGIKFDINNNIRLFLSDGDFIDIDMQNTEEDDFIKKIKEIDETISNDFLKKIYNFKHDRKEV